jgi:broad specificity phosphatase PhoE
MSNRHRIYLIRHGETPWSLSGQHTGNTDMALTERGRQQAAALGKFFAGRKFARVLCSPLSRAFDTCQLAGYGDVATLSDDLKEWDYGIYEGKKTIDIQQQEPGWSIWNTPVPQGESPEQVALRTRRIIQIAEAAEGDTALFAHGHVLRILTACWIGLAPTDGRLFALGTASVSILGWEHATRVLEVLNQDLSAVR